MCCSVQTNTPGEFQWPASILLVETNLPRKQISNKLHIIKNYDHYKALREQ